MGAGRRAYSTLLVACWVLCCGVCWQREDRFQPVWRRVDEYGVEGERSSEFIPDLQESELSTVNNTRRVIMPGTQWCGQGNRAKDFAELGSFKETDACCREHDHCDDVMAPGYLKHGLHNDGTWTRLHCDCDTRFWLCLHRTGAYSSIIQVGYFDLLKTVCFRKDYPV